MTRVGLMSAVISEGILLDERAHSSSAYARGAGGAAVHQVPLAVLEEARRAKPDVYYRIVARGPAQATTADAVFVTGSP